MEILVSEVMIDGIKWNVEYDEEYASGFKLWKFGATGGSARWMEMKAKKYSPIKSQREEWKEYIAEHKRKAQTRLVLVQQLVETAKQLSEEDIILKSDEEE